MKNKEHRRSHAMSLEARTLLVDLDGLKGPH